MVNSDNSLSGSDTPPEPFITDKVREAIENAQFLIAHVVKTDLEVDKNILKTLINAHHDIHQKKWSAEDEVEFWDALNKLTNTVKPVTVDSVKAIYPSMGGSLLGRLLGNSRARRTVNIYIMLTVVVLIVLLGVQIYWVIGNNLNENLHRLDQSEKELSLALSETSQEFSEIENRFQSNEWETERYQADGVYTFYYTPEWTQATLENNLERDRLESELRALNEQLNSNTAVLVFWSQPWNVLEDEVEPDAESQSQIAYVQEQRMAIEKKVEEDPKADEETAQIKEEIANLEAELSNLAADKENVDEALADRAKLISQIDYLENLASHPEQIIDQRQQDINRLKREEESLQLQLQNDKSKEASRQAKLAAEFVLIIMQKYLLPLLYGLLGAGTFILRSLTREIRAVTYSRASDVHYILRFSLGALAGLMVGWFVALLPGEPTILESVPPLAIAFLVGYNIEILFSLMDRFLDRFTDMELTASSSAPSQQRIQSQSLDLSNSLQTGTDTR